MSRIFAKLAIAQLIFILLVGLPSTGFSQTQTDTASKPDDAVTDTGVSGELKPDSLKSLRAEVENNADLAEDVKKAALTLLDRAINFAETEIRLQQEIAEIEKQVKTIPERIKATEIELDRPLPTSDYVATTASNMKPDQRENRLMTLEAELAEAKSELNRWSEQLSTIKDRPGRLPEPMAEAKKRLVVIGEELEKTPSPDDPPMLIKYRKMALAAEQGKLNAELELFEKQLANHDAFMALATSERDLADRKVNRQESVLKNWQEEVLRLRELEAKKERIVAEQEKKLAADLPPVVQKQYDIAIELGKLLEKITAEEAEIIERLELKQAALTQLEEDFALAREQVKYPLDSEALGMALREQRRTLPSIENFRRDSRLRRQQMGEIRAILLDLDRQRRELTDLDQVVEKILQAQSEIQDAELNMLRTELRRLLGERRETVKKLQTAAQRSFKNLQRLEFIEQQIAAKAREEAEFLDEHLLWIRSAKSIRIQDLQNLPAAFKWLLSPREWWQVAHKLMQSMMQSPIQWLLGLLIPAILVCLRPWAHRDLSRIARNVYSVKTDSFLLTLRALALTVRAPLGWPLLLGLTGWQLVRISASEEFAFAVGNGMIMAFGALAGSLFIYEICWKDGIAKVHFKWAESVRRTLRRNLRWFVPLLVISSFIVNTVQAKNEPVYTDSLGRLAMITYMLGFFGLIAYLLRFSGAIVSMLITRRSKSWLVRLRFIWYPLAMGVPLFLIVLAAMGYYYSASALLFRWGQTIALILGLIIAKDLVLRWLFIIQRRLVFEDVKRKKEAELQKGESDDIPDAIEGEAVVIEEPEINLDQIYEKNQMLLRTIIFFSTLIGLWLIWNNVLPALNFLENVKLWSYSGEVEGVRAVIPVTLNDLILAAILAIVIIVAAKNLPGLLDVLLLSRFSMDYGARHAFTTIFRYVITAVGVIVVFTTIGVKWSNLQWLIAALSVGLGFGLQEIVGNFVCGLIVLFERPFRIGDTVTIGDVSGTVTRIQIRATTIMDWDRKELIVPNKEFITGRLINWSLSDNIIRIKIPVGIAYGSDTELAEKLLLAAAQASPFVLKNPGPQAVFLGFGDSSLNFELRVFVNHINDWIPMLHKLNQTVEREFRKADVTISFPQRDVHLDQIGPLEVRVVSD